MKNFEINVTKEQLQKVTEHLLSKLKSRPAEIIKRRFGLDNRVPQVLDKIGKEFGVTRERIRQIEKDSFKKMHSANQIPEQQVIIELAKEIIRENGGFCEKNKLKQTLMPTAGELEKNQIMLLLDGTDEISYYKSNLELAGFWYLKEEIKPNQILEAHRLIVKKTRENQKPMKFSQIQSIMNESVWQHLLAGEFGKKRLWMILQMSRVIEKNILDEWGIKNWRAISQRGAREKAFLVLKKHNKPLHFREITKHINQHWKEKSSLPQTVHNELIKDVRFVLIGRGIYGLKKWGYLEGTVKEIIYDLLKKQQMPLGSEFIVKHILEKKRVKKTTIMVNLADKKLFLKNTEGLFALKENFK